MPVVNLDLLRRHVNWVLAEDQLPSLERHWEQNVWADHPALSGDEVREADLKVARDDLCSTYRCLAGNIVFEHGTLVVSDTSTWYARAELDDYAAFTTLVNGEPVTVTDIFDQANRLLGLTGAPHELFEPYNTADDIRLIAEEIAASVGETL